MQTKEMFLILKFLNEKEKVSRKEISAFLKQSVNLAQNRADFLINAISNTPEILAINIKNVRF